MNTIILFLKNWKTTLAGFIPFVVALLKYTGVINIQPDEFAEQFGNVFDGLILFFSGLVALIGLFAKDGDKSTEDLNK